MTNPFFIEFTTFLLILYLKTSVAWSADVQCTNYNVLPRDSERSLNNTVLPTGTPPCDNMADGWYRFGSGEIATYCVPTHHCGTTSTIWMKDPVPKVGETLDNDFCVNHQVGSPQRSCCLFSFKVKVTNCDGYMVYFFKKDNVLCPSGYCSAEMNPCKSGGTSTTGFEPCTYTAPSMDGPPTLHHPVPTPDGKDFTQNCEINYSGTDPDAAFLVKWMFDGAVYKQTTLRQGTTSATLTSSDWNGHLGQKLQCSVSSFFETNSTASYSRIMSSAEYFGGIQITPEFATIKEGSVGTFTLRSTLPILCPHDSPDHCDITFDVTINGGIAGGLFLENGCTAQIYGADWDNGKGMAETALQLSPLTDPLLKQHQHYEVSVSLRPTSRSFAAFKYQKRLSVNVTTVDVEHHKCLLVGESEVMGFNNNQTSMTGRYEGEMLMYNATGKNGKILQLQTKHWKPIGYLSVVCGIAFQHGDTLIVVEMCNNDHDLAVPIMTQGGRTPNDVQIYICDSNYEIVTSDGVRLSIVPQSLHLDLKLHLPPAYRYNRRGACFHDFPARMWSDLDRKMYSVAADESLFGNAGVPFYKLDPSPPTPSPAQCDCQGSQPVCGYFHSLSDPGAPLVNQVGETIHPKNRCTLYIPHALNPDYGPYASTLRPQLSSSPIRTTLAELQQKCDDAIYRHMTRFCVTRYPDMIDTFRRVCTNDIRASGSDKFVFSSMYAFQWWCEEESFKDVSLYRTNQNGGSVLSAELTSELCPNFCSLHGTCVHGICSCNSGTIGPGCSVFSNSSQPNIIGVKGGSMCQMSSLYCSSPILVADNLYPSDKLIAEVTLIELLNGYLVASNTSFNLEPRYDNHQSVTLHLSNVISTLKDQTGYGFLIRLSVDGVTFSKPFKYIVSDDKCQLCNVDNNVCYPKPNTCRIEHRCYYSGELNPKDKLQVCDPNRAILRWSSYAVSPTSVPQIIG